MLLSALLLSGEARAEALPRLPEPVTQAFATREIFASHLTLSISPFVEIEEEVRVILLDGDPRAVYSKERISDWRHNLDFGARPVLLEQGEALINYLAQMRDLIRGKEETFAGHAVLGVPPTSGLLITPEVLGSFKTRWPYATLLVREGISSHL